MQGGASSISEGCDGFLVIMLCHSPLLQVTLVDWQLRTSSVQGSVLTSTSLISLSSFYQNKKPWIALFLAVLSYSEWFFVLMAKLWCAKPDVTVTWVPARAVFKHKVWKLYGSIKLRCDQYSEWLQIYVFFCLTFRVVKWAVWWISLFSGEWC